MDKELSVYISTCIRAVPLDLIRPKGTIILTFDENNFKIDSALFCIQAEDYLFYAGIAKNEIEFRRNNYKLRIPVNHTFTKYSWISLFFEWSPTFLKLSYFFIPFINKKAEQEINTPYTVAPPSLIRLLRKQNLIETNIYNSETSFRDKIYSILGTLQETINSFLSENVFWDITYEGGKVISMIPKRETDLHSILQGLLLDQFLMSSIDVIPEYSMGVGRLDFMLLGSVKDIGISKVCLEVKHGHSSDIYSGLTKQLPMYMENAQAYNGVYLVLWYGKSLKPSEFNSYETIGLQLLYKELENSHEFSKRIRIFILDLTKSPKASYP